MTDGAVYKRFWMFAILALTIASGCAHPAAVKTVPMQSPAIVVDGAPLTPLPGDELKQLFRNVSASTELTEFAPERFGADGSYSAGDLHIVTGRFWVERDEVCYTVDEAGPPLCRRFARSASGEIFETWQRWGRIDQAVTPPQKYRIRNF